MDNCCHNKQNEISKLVEKQRSVLKTVFAINFIMFFIEMIYSYRAKSTSLMADGLDMLGDAFVYGVSLYVIGKSTRINKSISTLKGFIMLFLGLGVLGQAIYRFSNVVIPSYEVMGIVAVIAFVANLTCAVLLLRHRSDDLNMKSTWLCSRNDVISNLGVILAAFLVNLFNSNYPDLIVGIAIATIILNSSVHVLKESFSQPLVEN